MIKLGQILLLLCFVFIIAFIYKQYRNIDTKKFSSDFESRFFSAEKMDFSREKGAHNNMQVEWWYLAANLNDTEKNDRRFNVALLLLKNSTSFVKITNLENGETYAKKISFLNDDLFSKDVLDINFDHGHFFETGLNEYKISFNQDEIEFNLVLESLKDPLVIMNDNKYFNYQQTKIKTDGEIIIDGTKYKTTGYSWLEHQGFHSQSDFSYASWRWVPLQLDNGVELLWINIFPRKEIGTDALDVIVVYDKGERILLNSKDFSIDNKKYWERERYGDSYPISTHLKIPSLSADLTIEIAPVDNGPDQLNGIFEGGGVASGFYNNEEVNGLAHQEIKTFNNYL